MSDDKPRWMNAMSLATVILAVAATLSTFKGGGYSTQSVINQSMASDQWSFYQAKSTKQHLYELHVEQLRLQALALPPTNPANQAIEQTRQKYQAEIQRYSEEKKQIEAKARQLEGQRDEAKNRGRPFGLAVIFLQVAILLNSIAGLMKAEKVWWASAPVAVIGLVFFTDGFFAFF